MSELPALSHLPAFISAHPEVRGPLGALLDRYEKSGRLPRTMTLDADWKAERALGLLFSARAVNAGGQGKVRVDLARSLRESGLPERDLLSALYAALGRQARDRAGDARRVRAELERALSALMSEAKTDLSRRFLEAQIADLRLATSELAAQAEASGAPAAVERARQTMLCLDAVRSVQAPIRIQNFSARVLGSSKALRSGGELWRSVATALVDFDPLTRRALDEQGAPPLRESEIKRALDVNGIYQDEAAASVLCFGPLVYRKTGQTFDYVARHADLGEASRLILHQLRDAEFERPKARRITVFENLTPFLDYVDACAWRGLRDEIVLCSGGQASFAVVALLSGLAGFGIPMRHSGDLDRSGVLILRSLRRRSRARLQPLLMDAATHARFEHLGQPLSKEERARLEQLVRSDDQSAPCHELLKAILRSGVWIEQEHFADEGVARALEPRAHS